MQPKNLDNPAQQNALQPPNNQYNTGSEIMMETEAQYPSTKTVKTLYSQLQSAYERRDGRKLSRLLRELYNDPAYNTSADKWKLSLSYDRYSGSNVGVLFGKILEGIRQFQAEKLKKGAHFAFKLHLEVLSHILKIIEEIKDESTLWLCEPLRQVIRSTKKIYLAASKQDKESGGGEAIKKDTVIIKLQEFKTKRSLIDQVKKQILPLIDNLQVSILFLSHNYDQIIRIIDNTKAYGEHGPAFVDNYHFQKGKAALIYQKFEAAEKYFESIHIRTQGQKRLVLKYLIPCKMFLGKTFVSSPNRPEEQFPEYLQLSQSLRCAKLSDYSQAISKYQKVWIKRGIYLLMDELRIILWRNLIKKVHRILEDDKINIEKIHTAVRLSGGSESLEECMCIISNLIYEGYIKGYIFQNEEHKVLVIKKGGEGFPALSKLAAG